jgi:hypothetical protein
VKTDTIKGKVLNFPAGGRRKAEPELEILAPSQSLVPLTADIDAREQSAPMQRQAAFIAQLLATQAQVPQVRERRRAEPDEAVHAYQAALGAIPCKAGQKFSRDS